MKKIFLPALLLVLSLGAVAQKKPKQKPPSQKEMQEMMKEMQEGMEGMSEEDKRMMDSLGFKMPNMKNMQQTAVFAAANADGAPQELAVPKRDALRIAGIPKAPLTRSALPAYLQLLHQKITASLPAGLQEQVKNQLAAVAQQGAMQPPPAAAAVGYLTLGNRQAALLLLSEACKAEPSNDDHLNNFAALLNMNGGEHLALPILQMLNRQYPNNSTILNNIAHAWFGLGDVANASKYIDSTIRLCAWHPQANQIKAAIEESKGNHDAAVKAMKQAISKMHTTDKERALNDLGYELQGDDIHWSTGNKPDQLGLSRFEWPTIPKSLDESERLEPEWLAFRNGCDLRIAELKTQHARLLAAYQEAYNRRMQHDINAPKTGARFSMMSEGIVPKAVLKLRPYLDEQLALEAKEPTGLELIKLDQKLDTMAYEHNEVIRKINEAMAPGGEGIGVSEGYCEAIDAANSKYINDVNTLVEAVCTRLRNRAKKRIMAMVDFKMYAEFPEKFELSVVEAKLEWMSIMSMPYGDLKFRSSFMLCNNQKENPKPSGHKLADFDDLNCQYRSRFALATNSIEVACGKTIVKIDVPSIKSEWEFRSADREKDRNLWNEFQRCTIEVSAGESKKLGKGPLQLEAKAEVTGILEFDRSGLKDAAIKAEIGVGVKTNTMDTKVETDIGEVSVGASEKKLSFGGAEATISINSGFTAGGTGILKGVKF